MKVCLPSQTEPKRPSAGVGWALDGWCPCGRSPFHMVSTCISLPAPWSVTLDLELVDVQQPQAHRMEPVGSRGRPSPLSAWFWVLFLLTPLPADHFLLLVMMLG